MEASVVNTAAEDKNWRCESAEGSVSIYLCNTNITTVLFKICGKFVLVFSCYAMLLWLHGPVRGSG